MRSTILLIAILLLAPCHGGTSPVSTQNNSTQDKLYVSHYENVLGTSLELKIVAASPAQSDKAEQAVLAEIDREAHILSSWDPDSEFSRWFRTMNQPVHISPELFEVLNLFDRWRERTGGALDASAETITRVWKNAAAQKRLPAESELCAAVFSVKRVHWKLDPAHQMATHTSDAPLALNSFVKSYIAGRAADAALGVPGVRATFVNIGGDLVIRGEWSEHVDISDPKSDAENGAPIARLVLRNQTVATSGDYRRGVEIQGQHYSHIVDPRTGMLADEIISSTVVAPTPADAGALATALSVLTPEESERLVRREICADTGLLASRFSTSRISELFLKGTEPKEDSAGWFAADGKLLLPAEYAGWCASSNNTRGAHPRPKAGITNPIANARYEIDPVLPRSQQMIELTATLGDRVQWFVNGTQIAPQSDGRFFWQVAPGQWNIRAVSPGGSAEETIFIE